VARDFDLGESRGMALSPAASAASPAQFDVAEALRSLATLADRLRREEKDLPNERKL